MSPPSFRIQHHPEALRQYYALPTGLFQRVRAELDELAELAMAVAPAPGTLPALAAVHALPGRLELRDVVLTYTVEWEARTVTVHHLARPAVKVGGGAE